MATKPDTNTVHMDVAEVDRTSVWRSRAVKGVETHSTDAILK